MTPDEFLAHVSYPAPSPPVERPRASYHDRCDRCGVAALALVLFPTGQDLAFCAHHLRAHEPALRLAGAVVLSDLDLAEWWRRDEEVPG